MSSSDDVEECFYGYDDDDEEGAGEDEEDWGGEGLLVEEEAASPERPVDCWAITKESLPAAQQQDLSMVMNLLYIKQHQARSLLIHHRWKVDSVLDHLGNKGRDSLLGEAGVVLQQEANSGTAPAAMASPQHPRGSSSVTTCYVCFEEASPDAVSTMDCGHCFCNDCWTEHFFASVNGGQKQIRCMEVGCAAICDEAVVQRLLGGKYPDAARRLDHFLLESYVEDNGAVRWCPSAPHCGRAIRVDGGDRCCDMSCPCGVSFCFSCGAAPPHSPCPCAMWAKWDAKCHGEFMNLDWIRANTKNCPRCFNPIEKNGGCNLVTCRCGQHLCWLCGGATGSAHSVHSIEGHSCNRFVEEEQKEVDDARRKVLRYTHYYDRFKVHGDSRRSELEELGPAVEERVRRLESSAELKPAMDTARALGDAHRALLGSRHVLSRSYAFAYHMFGGEERTWPEQKAAAAQAQALFEDHQEMAERHVEKLSQLLATDSPVTEGALRRAKQEAITLTAVVEKHCGEMHKCIQDELLPMLIDTTSIAAYRPTGPIEANDFPPCV
ncbi:probable E3 ubiquitin-protein ligase ARI1 [Oryza brachyantha]|uniref:probable E3 ubiquitin-protein ligase ARI1 n=1 Tax=Oryza brachyantha TaxID=4533 RepID=UPI001ADCABAA|nr:probable E3 ubiquitin-protein ligase ARI1 [Oryza brachyantha]